MYWAVEARGSGAGVILRRAAAARLLPRHRVVLRKQCAQCLVIEGRLERKVLTGAACALYGGTLGDFEEPAAQVWPARPGRLVAKHELVASCPVDPAVCGHVR